MRTRKHHPYKLSVSGSPLGATLNLTSAQLERASYAHITVVYKSFAHRGQLIREANALAFTFDQPDSELLNSKRFINSLACAIEDTLFALAESDDIFTAKEKEPTLHPSGEVRIVTYPSYSKIVRSNGWIDSALFIGTPKECQQLIKNY